MRTASLAAAALLLASSAAAALTPAEIERLKASATATAATAKKQGTINADGTIARGEDGKLASAPLSSANAANQLEYVKRIQGVEEVSSGAHPTSGAAGGAVRGKQSVDFQCGREEGMRKSAGGVSVVLAACYGTSLDAVQALKLSFCTATTVGEVCRPDLFTSPAVIKAGAYDEVADGLTAGFACNSAGACRVTVLTDYSVRTTGAAAMASQSQGAAANNSSLAQNLRDSAAEIASSNLYETVGRKMVECVESVDSAMAGTSELATCSKDKAVANPVSDSGADCEAEWVCDQEATQSATFTRQCTVTKPVTGYRCTWSVPTYECSVTQAGSAPPARACTGSSAAVPEELVNSSEKTCTAQDSSGTCTAWAWTEYYGSPSKQTALGDCQAGPLALLGSPATSCARGGAGELTACEADGWYRRSLSESECTVSSTDADGVSHLYPLTEKEKPGCGMCAKPVTEDTCYGVPTATEPANSCAHIETDPSCVRTDAVDTPESLEGGAGGVAFAVAYQRSYTCQVTETSCVKRHQTTSCPTSDLTKGLDNLEQETPSTQATMNEALAGVATLDALGQAAEACQKGNDPQKVCASTEDVRIFTGEDLRCRRPVGFLSGLSNDCCNINLQRPGGDAMFNACKLSEAELASARRANLTHFVGEYCSKETWYGKCKMRTQTYCSFPGILAKVIQQQGRVQLAAAVSSGLSAPESTAMSFDYYAGSGQWTPPAAAGGVLVAAWQTPQACSADNGPPSCPTSLVQWFAVCDPLQGGCGDLPLTPESGSDTWNIAAIDPLSTVAYAVSSRATVSGSCNTETSRCAYDVTVVPTGSGGMVTVQRNLSFPVATLEAAEDSYPVFLGTTVIKPVVGSTASEAPRTLSISVDGGTHWASLTVPFKINGSLPLGSTGATISGGCSLLSNTCQYTVHGSVQLTAKPWGSPKYPDCSGFTLDQLSALDFSRMDLSEWIASVMNKLSMPDTSKLVSQAATDSQRYFAVYQGTEMPAPSTASSPVAANTAAVTPRQGWGPFKAFLRVGSNYPEVYGDPARDNDPIFGVTVDWGDCTAPEQAGVVDEMVTTGSGTHRASGFSAEHVYVTPDRIACTDRGPRNITHTIKITINSKSGVHETSAQVLNIWTGHKDTVGFDEGKGGKSAH